MKRALCIVIALTATALLAEARPYTYLDPPSIAVVDFEVSMSAADKEASKAYYGELVSQALLTVLVQQNAAAVVKVATGADGTLLATTGATAANTGGEEVRHYFPPLVKIFDKKYVELALQNATYTTKDLYTKSVGAFNFTNLDYVVLGNVYETKRAAGMSMKDAIGFNVRVLNTTRSEELYSYTEVVDKDLSDLPAACARIARTIVRDILNSTCAQFIITDVSGVKTPYRLFWQSRQVEREDNTVTDSDDSYKRELRADQFYWVLPGQYVISVYNVETQRIRTIPFTISAGDIKHVTVEKQHLEAERGSITIGGVFPTDSYIFSVREQKRREQYWWEVGGISQNTQSFTVTFSNGENPEVKMDSQDAAEGNDKDTIKAEFRAATNELVIRNVMLSSYDVTATSQPPSSSYDITGWWKVSTRQISQSSKPLPLDLRTQGDAKLQIADFGLQEKKVLDSPHKTKVTFLLNPGFGYDTTLYIDDGSDTGSGWLWWRNKEKVTIESEYSQAEWDALPFVTFTFEPNFTFKGVSDLSIQRQYRKADLDPARDFVVILDMNAEATTAKAQRAANAATTKAAAATTPEAASTRASTGVAATGTAAAAGSSGGVYLNTVASLGYEAVTYYTKSGTYSAYSSTSTGLDIGGGASLIWSMSPGFGLGFGGIFHYATGNKDTFAADVTANLMLGDPARQDITLLMNVGFGSGFAIEGGVAFTNKKNGGLTLQAGFFSYGASSYDITVNSTDYNATGFSAYLEVGYMLGF